MREQARIGHRNAGARRQRRGEPRPPRFRTGIFFPDGTVQPGPGGCEAGSCTTRDSGPTAVCGDGLLNRLGETCDDGNIEPDDGCTANCQLMDNFACPVPGEKCVSTVKCGDGRISVGPETCDDHNAIANDGCDATCHLEPGWDCAVQGTLCTAALWRRHPGRRRTVRILRRRRSHRGCRLLGQLPDRAGVGLQRHHEIVRQDRMWKRHGRARRAMRRRCRGQHSLRRLFQLRGRAQVPRWRVPGSLR